MIHKIQQKAGLVKFGDLQEASKGENVLKSLSGKLPTSTTGLTAGDLYSDSGTVKVKAS